MCWSQTSGRAEISLMKSTASECRQAGRRERIQLPSWLGCHAMSALTARSERIHMEETSQRCRLWGKGHQHGGTGGYQESEQQTPVPSEGALHLSAFTAAPHDYFLALLLDIRLRRTPPNCKCKRCARIKLAFQFALRCCFCTSLGGLWLLALGLGFPYAASPSFFFLEKDNPKHIVLDPTDTTLGACL